jgi:DNA-binding transcriptional MerR regulator
MEEPWTILELAELAADALAATAPTNGRVRDVPNERLVRWYVTVGLVDPALSRRGRVARYGRRHLLQLVAVKRRQAEGRSLAEIQAELAGATDETLAAIARLEDTQPARQASLAPPDRFWARQPRQPGRAAPVAAARREGPARGEAQGGRADRDGGAPGGLVYGIRLAPGVTLLLEGADREPSPDDLTDITDAAAPLLRELASRRLRVFGPGHPDDVPGQSPGAGHLAEGAGHDH